MESRGGGLAVGTRKQTAEIPELRATVRRIAAWRATKRYAGERMPKELWGEAVAHCRVHGVGATAKGLGIDVGRLRMLAGASATGKRQRQAASTAEFVDLGPVGELARATGLSGTATTMVVEVELASGDRLTIRASGANGAEALQLVREFRGR